MKKLLLSSLAAAALSLASLSALAATVPANFTVSVKLAAKCEVTVDNPTVDFGTYTSFQTVAATGTATGPITVKCTRDLAQPVLSFDTPGASVGLIAGLNYTLSSLAGAPAVGSSATGVAGTGSATTHSYTLSGNMPAGQAGHCATAGSIASVCDAAAVTATRTVTLTY